ncbi:MAG: flagellum-specific ATP synthase FliI, partial [Gammaproteobacteria bacterium]|nr:flagellum-specific ATP synthase FliI [Gammaproteobacteria bacterium]
MTWTTAEFVSRLQRETASPQLLFKTLGRVRRAVGSSLEISGCKLGLGQRCSIELPTGAITAEIVGFHDGITHVQPYGDVTGLQVGARVSPLDTEPRPRLDALLGRVVNGLGEPLDGSPIRTTNNKAAGAVKPINPLQRQPISEQLDLGVRSINALLSVGVGQRVGLFSGSGVGKSVLLGMLARFVKADIVVVALIGERGREVREFIEENLGEGLSRSVVVVSPADDSPVLRIRAAFLATEIAASYRTEGKNVLLLMDSLTRIAQAQREVGLAAGEPPTTKGYTPSVFRLLPRLVERAGTSGPDEGAITAIYTVLTE